MGEEKTINRREVLRKSAAVGVGGLGAIATVGTVAASPCRYKQGTVVTLKGDIRGCQARKVCESRTEIHYIDAERDAVVNYCCAISRSGTEQYGVTIFDNNA